LILAVVPQKLYLIPNEEAFKNVFRELCPFTKFNFGGVFIANINKWEKFDFIIPGGIPEICIVKKK
jgi:hypothetical protein